MDIEKKKDDLLTNAYIALHCTRHGSHIFNNGDDDTEKKGKRLRAKEEKDEGQRKGEIWQD